MMKIILFVLIFPSLPALAAGKCGSRVKLAALDWAAEVFESDIETDGQVGDQPLSIEIKSPILQDKSKNAVGVSEVYSLDWKLKFKDKSWDYTGFYFFDENCHRMKTAEFKAGKEAERRSANKKTKN